MIYHSNMNDLRQTSSKIDSRLIQVSLKIQSAFISVEDYGNHQVFQGEKDLLGDYDSFEIVK